MTASLHTRQAECDMQLQASGEASWQVRQNERTLVQYLGGGASSASGGEDVYKRKKIKERAGLLHCHTVAVKIDSFETKNP